VGAQEGWHGHDKSDHADFASSQHRILVNMQREIEDESGIRLDGTGGGNSCSIELINFKAVIKDVLSTALKRASWWLTLRARS
jgi:hypothetical protein